MDNDVFRTWLEAIRTLTRAQRQKGFQILALAEAEDSVDVAGIPGSEECLTNTPAPTPASRIAEASVSTRDAPSVSDPVLAAAQSRIASTGCPHCGGKSLGRWGRASGLPRYRCDDCRRTFNALTGTPLARLRKKERWVDQGRALMSGESIAKAAKRCGVAYTTAFRWRHRFLSAPASDKPAHLSGIVEADETFILESFKGKRRGLPRPARKRGGKAVKRGLSREQIPVLVARDRTGATTDAVLPKLSRAAVTAALAGVVTPANQLCCDGGKAIVGFAREGRIPCHILPAPGGPIPEAPTLHINNVNGYHGRLKEWLRPFHGVATRYLDHYLGWRRAVEARGDTVQCLDWLQGAMGIGPYQQLAT